MAATVQRAWPFVESRGLNDSSVLINASCRLQTQDGCRVVTVIGGVLLAAYAVGDLAAEAYAMVNLVDHGHALQVEVAAAFKCSERTVWRHRRRFEQGGLAALGRPRGYPRGRQRLPETRTRLINLLKARGASNREIARQLGVSEKAIRKTLRRLGWQPPRPEQLSLLAEDADSKVSDAVICEPDDGAEIRALPQTSPASSAPVGEDPKLSYPDAEGVAQPVSCDTDPGNREVDRLLASLGLIEDAAPQFRSASDVPNAGVLLAIPALLDSGVIDIARDVYGTIGPAFYGLRTIVVLLLQMALMRIKRLEDLKKHNPADLGRLLGLDRVPEVKTVRRKLARLAACGRAAEFGRALSERRVQARGHAMGFLYVDGHVRAYHGKRPLPKAYVARRHLAMPATTDYWVNDAAGEPLLVITSEANKQLMTMLPEVLDEVRSLVGDRRVTVVFDRGGWSPKLFKKIIADGFDILTYRKGKFRRVANKQFRVHEGIIGGKELSYTLADREVRLLKQSLRLRQVTRLAEDGHQIGIVTSRRDLPALEVVYRLTERWRQENFFKYLREQYALDALVDYSTEPADEQRMVPNPERRKVSAQLRKANVELNQLAAQYGLEALDNPESKRPTVRGFKIAHAPLSKAMADKLELIKSLEKRLAKMPTRVPVQTVVDGDVVKLSTERKYLSDLLKMVAYQAECDLLRLLEPHYRRAEEEGRAFVRSALMNGGDIQVADGMLRVVLHPLSAPHRTKALVALCDLLNSTPARFPGSKLQLHFSVKPEPPVSPAFPGPRSREGCIQADGGGPQGSVADA